MLKFCESKMAPAAWILTALNPLMNPALFAAADTPDMLDTTLDKPQYRPGEQAQLRIAPRFAGRATVAVVAGGVLATRVVDVPEGGTTVPLDVTEAWRPGAYVVAVTAGLPRLLKPAPAFDLRLNGGA